MIMYIDVRTFATYSSNPADPNQLINDVTALDASLSIVNKFQELCQKTVPAEQHN